MSLPVYIHFPAKPVVAQYILNKYGAPAVLPDGDWLKCLFENLLSRGTDHNGKRITLQYYTVTAALPIEFHIYERYGNHLTKDIIVCINNRIEEEIHQRLFMFYEFYHKIGGLTIKDTAKKFQEVYHFHDEAYSIDNIVKQFQRNIKKPLEKSIGASVLRNYVPPTKGINQASKRSRERILGFQTLLNLYEPVQQRAS